MDSAWVRSIRAQCLAQGVAFFFKQWGGFHRKEAGRKLDGRTWDEMPVQVKQPRGRVSSVA
jgi:protein gp37